MSEHQRGRREQEEENSVAPGCSEREDTREVGHMFGGGVFIERSG